MTANVLQRLPYDVLDVVFTFVDNPTLLKISLASHELNRLSSKYIHAAVELNPRQGSKRGFYKGDQETDSAIYALQRRPELRSAVKSAKINCTQQLPNDLLIKPSISSTYYDYEANKYLTLLPLLPNLQEIMLATIYDQNEGENILDAIERLPRLRRLILSPYVSLGEHNLPNVYEFKIITNRSRNAGWNRPQVSKRVFSIQHRRSVCTVA
ncbi:SubName: Full=Uncharacterized protein {ECO:0000313/EMBL:CCA67386.1} [Serendipita indica DSM 11827]|uniref:F-box domain-containing protein n=1 Tax=Serendipita indica (strain DSM 11827) TaxID=1109443 RepID=G4T7U1_SERID|nr:SubName: Full=Uncharacterized protein {ECO:0000313/EMBL:CCA67386.1} [Serendipita indica DSM 11827]CCA67386.1 hypothetical protein PIIN_01217 [Serendipita indica DSM 11827]